MSGHGPIRRIIGRLGRLATKPASTQSPGSYREAPADTSADALRDLHEFMALQSRRIRTLERQLAARGETPVATPSVHEFRQVVALLESLASGDGCRLNTPELRVLADSMRGLAMFDAVDP